MDSEVQEDDIVGKQVSKNARRESRSDKIHCACGGEIKMITRFINGKKKHLAQCQSCKKESRKPKDLL
jgi:hypothetical protein